MSGLYATQGGGTCRASGEHYIWVEPPKDFPGMVTGGVVPAQWGIVPINKEAHEEVEGYDHEDYSDGW